MCISIPGSTGFPGMGHPRIVPEIPGYKVFQDPWVSTRLVQIRRMSSIRFFHQCSTGFEGALVFFPRCALDGIRRTNLASEFPGAGPLVLDKWLSRGRLVLSNLVVEVAGWLFGGFLRRLRRLRLRCSEGQKNETE